jgi:hypothetical protein
VGCSRPQYSSLSKTFTGDKVGFLAEKEKYTDPDRCTWAFQPVSLVFLSHYVQFALLLLALCERLCMGAWNLTVCGVSVALVGQMCRNVGKASSW